MEIIQDCMLGFHTNKRIMHNQLYFKILNINKQNLKDHIADLKQKKKGKLQC